MSGKFIFREVLTARPYIISYTVVCFRGVRTFVSPSLLQGSQNNYVGGRVSTSVDRFPSSFFFFLKNINEQIQAGKRPQIQVISFAS